MITPKIKPPLYKMTQVHTFFSYLVMSDRTLKTKNKAFVRNMQKPISDKVDQDVQYHVEIKSVSIRNVNIPVNKLKDRNVNS